MKLPLISRWQHQGADPKSLNQKAQRLTLDLIGQAERPVKEGLALLGLVGLGRSEMTTLEQQTTQSIQRKVGVFPEASAAVAEAVGVLVHGLQRGNAVQVHTIRKELVEVAVLEASRAAEVTVRLEGA